MQRRDGKAGRLLSGNQFSGRMPGVIYGRFLTYDPEGPATKNYLLYDVEAGMLLDTGIRQQGEVMQPGRNDRNPQHFFERKDGTTLIDLSKIR